MSAVNTINLDRLYKNEEHADVVFIVRNRSGYIDTIPAHRQILMSRSPVFDRMFYGGLKEGAAVEITDVCAEAFDEFLQLFYLAVVDLTTNNLAEVLRLIDKYDCVDFWPACEAFMQRTLTQPLAFDYLELALSFDLADNVKNRAEDMLCMNPKELFEVSAVRPSNPTVLATILQSDKLMACEIDIFDGLMAWAKAAVHQKKQRATAANIAMEVGECLQHIRFPLMTTAELLACFTKYPTLLPPEQRSDILNYVATKEPLTDAKHFSCERRTKVYAIGFINCGSAVSGFKSAVLMRWSNDYPMKFAVECALFAGRQQITDCFSVRVYRNNQQVLSHTLQLEPCHRGCLCLLKLTDPIEFLGRNDTVKLTITLQSTVPIFRYYTHNAAPDAVMPQGFTIDRSGANQYSFVSEIRLKEKF